MKNLTEKELLEAPEKVRHIYVCALSGVPVGVRMYEEAFSNYPEYFPDEVVYRKKYDAIPQSVHDAYFAELNEKVKDIYKDVPNKGVGFMFFVNNYKEYKKTSAAYAEARKIEKKIEEKLMKKYYSQYGI